MELNIVGLVVLGVVISALALGIVLVLTKMSRSSVIRLSNLFLTIGWLLPFGVCALFVSAWVVDIVIPTLKGASFNDLYDYYGIRYLDISLVSFVVGFIWFAFVNIKAVLMTKTT